MKKYNRDKRGAYNAHTRKLNTHETCDTCDRRPRIHIPIHYDGYDRIEYITIIHTKTRDNKAHIHIGMTNAMNELFPEINAPHTHKTHRGTAPYHKYIPQATTYTRPVYEEEEISKDTRTAKCIIYDMHDKIIHIGRLRRTRIVNYTKGTIDITLHKGTRTMKAYEHAINPDTRIHGMTVREIKAHDVEIYHI